MSIDIRKEWGVPLYRCDPDEPKVLIRELNGITERGTIDLKTGEFVPMVVKVIDPTPDPAIVKRISCRNCGARLEYTPNDVKTYSGTDYSGGPDGCDWVDCPNCGKRAVIRSW